MKYENSNIREVFGKLKGSKNGLTEKEVEKRLKKYGFNELKEKNKTTPFKVLLRQFTNFIVWVLFAAAIISLLIEEILNFWVISFIICFVIILGFVQEYRAEKAMEALKKIVQPKTRVLRNGKVREILTRDVAPGDILLLETGDKIPADAKLFEIIGLRVDEAALTGESAAVEKKKGDLIFAGTQIVHGKCKALVIATGMQTKLGNIAGMIQEVEEKTPLQIKIAQLAKRLAIIALIACVFTFTLGLLRGAPIAGILIVALALAVAAIPEGLPLTLTLTLAYGMHRMAKHNAIIRKMLAVETLGSTTVICTDKTGTLTRNEMTVERVFVNDAINDVSGVGYEPKGEFYLKGNKVNLNDKASTLLFKASALCNNSILEEKEGKWEVIGDPTEAALVVLSAKAGQWKDDLEEEYKRVEEVLFTSERKMMSVVCKKGKERIAFVKGAPEIVLEKCRHIQKDNKAVGIDKKELKSILKINKDFASSALRVLALAYKKVSGPLTPENIEKDLIFLGLVGMEDPPREEVKGAIETCQKAGIEVVMITGDHEHTARAIAKEIGLFEQAKKLGKLKDNKLKRIVKDGVITGIELDELSEKEFEIVVGGIVIYARIRPEQKLRIVSALKQKGHVVAMTGDGVNDAPAVKKADVGIAMGIKGTDVTREASDMVLQDDNFAAIVEAVKGGRTIYENIEKFTCYLISRNYCEVLLILLGVALLGFKFLPLLALQILFLNVIGEDFPAIALGLDSPRKDIMLEPPRNPKQGILTKRNLTLVFSLAAFMTVMAFMVFKFADPAANIERARTMAFAAIIGMVIFNTLNFRSLNESIFKTDLLPNRWLVLAIIATILSTLSVMYLPFLQGVFELTTLGLLDWVFPLSAAFTTLIFAEIIKTKIRNITQ